MNLFPHLDETRIGIHRRVVKVEKRRDGARVCRTLVLNCGHKQAYVRGSRTCKGRVVACTECR